ncbi:hypothetical protein MMC27_003293 [Xylographa pallens]|nr:hypothetical protein [Xylographa pallens]
MVIASAAQLKLAPGRLTGCLGSPTHISSTWSLTDPLSITVSLVGLGGAAIKTATSLFRFGETIFRARKQIKALATELAHFAIAPKSLARVLEEHGSLLEPRLLEEVNVHVRECRSILRSIKQDCNVSTSRELTLLDRTKWYFRDDKVKRLQARLERAKASLTLIVGILNLAASLSTRDTHGQPERIQERYEDAALFVEVTYRAFERNRELEIGIENEELEDDELDLESDLSLNFGISTRTGSPSAATALSLQLSTNNSPALTISRLHTSPSQAPAVVRQLLLCWTNVEDVSPLPTAPGCVAPVEIEDLSMEEDGAQSAPRVQESPVNSYYAASNATQNGIDLSRMRASSSLSSIQNDPGPPSQDAATASSANRGLHLRSENITRPITPSQGYEVDPDNCDTDTVRTDIHLQTSKNGTQDVCEMVFRDALSLPVPIAYMNTFSGQIKDRSWDPRYFSLEGLKLLNFCVIHRKFTGYFAIPWNAAQHWGSSNLNGPLLCAIDIAGVGSVVPAACLFFMEGYRARLLEASQRRLESNLMAKVLAQEVEDARTAYNMARQGNFVLYRMKRFRPGPNDREDSQRIRRREWDKELARSDYHTSEFYIKVELDDRRQITAHEKDRSSRAPKRRFADKKGENSDQYPSLTALATLGLRTKSTVSRRSRASILYDD